MDIQYIDRSTGTSISDKDGIQKAVVESFSKRYADVMSVVRKNSMKVVEINDKILELMNMKHMYLMDSHAEVRKFLLEDRYIRSVHEAYCDYEKVGMKSKKVKDVVMDTRSLFFDDTKEEFKEYEFVSFLYYTYRSPSYRLCFSNGEKEFAISVPFMVQRLSEIQQNENIYSMFSVVLNVNPSLVGTFGRKMTVEGIRKDILKFIDRDFVPDRNVFNADEGSITPLSTLVDKYYGDRNEMDDTIPYYYRRDLFRKGNF